MDIKDVCGMPRFLLTQTVGASNTLGTHSLFPPADSPNGGRHCLDNGLSDFFEALGVRLVGPPCS